MTFCKKTELQKSQGKTTSLTTAARGCDTGDMLMTEKAAGKNFSCDGTVLYLDCAGAYITMHLPKCTELDTEKENSLYVDQKQKKQKLE